MSISETRVMAPSTSLEATAHHEAGHAVAAWDQRVRLKLISIVPDIGRTGFVHIAPAFGRFTPDEERSPRVRIRGERLIRIWLAGPIAQRKFNPRSIRRYHGEQDFKNAYDVLAYLAISDEHTQVYMRHLEIEAAGIVDRHWAVIRALAAEILARRKMKGAEADRFIWDWFATDHR